MHKAICAAHTFTEVRVMKKMEIAAMLGFAAALMISSFSKSAATLYALEDDVVRLHILANSDSYDDQLLKYAVRDAVLENGSCYFEDIDSTEEAAVAAELCLPALEEIARKTVAEKGYDYTVTAEYEKIAFDERMYEDITMPAGVYNAVRINIGKAEGQNWWCVMYPPLCVPVASEDENLQEEYFTEDEKEMLNDPQKFRYKLKCLEWLSELWNKVCE